MKSFSRREFLKLGGGTALLGAAMSLGLVGCGPKDAGSANNKTGKFDFTVGYLPLTHSLPLFVAHQQNKNKYQKINLELQKFSAWPELTEAFNSGAVLGAVTMFELAMLSHQKGLPTQIISLTHRNGDALVAIPEITKIEELKGKTVAIPHRMSGHNILLYKALKDAGLKYDEIQVREMAPPDMAAALASGEVQAYIVAEPFGAQSVVNGKAKALLRAQDIWPNWLCCGLVTKPDLVEKNHEALQELVDSLVAAGQFIQDKPEEAIQIAQEYAPIKAEFWRQSLKWASYQDFEPKVAEFEQIESYLKEMSLLPKEVDLNALVNPVFFKK